MTERRVRCTYIGLGGGVKGCTPCFHAIRIFISVYNITGRDMFAKLYSHKWVIDRDNKDLAGVLKLVTINVAGDMSGRARRA